MIKNMENYPVDNLMNADFSNNTAIGRKARKQAKIADFIEENDKNNEGLDK
jgi:hypothetical protein